MHDNDTVLCGCGCGQPAPISTYTDARLGYVKGQPRRFIRGHNQRRPHSWRVDPETGCWLWDGRLSANGYGFVGITGRGGVPAHRWVYERQRGAIPDGLQIDHLCRTRACVNPDHMEVVTAAVNTRRGLKTKLSPADVSAIRTAPASETNAVLAERFGVHNSQISRIRSQRSWSSD